MLTQDFLHSIYEYRDGDLYYRHSRGTAKAGKKVGYQSKDKVTHVFIDRKSYLLHRLIFLMHYGYLPYMVDHIDGDRSNNRIENLRAATHAENCWNAKSRKDSKTGVKNVKFDNALQKYMVRVTVNKQRHFIGSYEDLELAELVAVMAREKYHGKFAKHGDYYANK